MTRYHITEIPKAAHLDADRQTPLDPSVAEAFANAATLALNQRAGKWLDASRMEVLATIISDDTLFPFSADLSNGQLQLRANMTKQPPVTVKHISDGLTAVCQKLIVTLMRTKQMPDMAETFKMEFPQILHPALMRAYEQSGLPDGPHTKYVCRG